MNTGKKDFKLNLEVIFDGIEKVEDNSEGQAEHGKVFSLGKGQEVSAHIHLEHSNHGLALAQGIASCFQGNID
eukprot:CAMPEP_0117858988 /NCGR_PEP_ID=MMETSP0950-20121206/2849_1 /TAXON_ID=44440 /ORGANISM="Chattonella subsalsa, Strain CCMP2191" /LENGTH=72 /DNA_ID=CAMNT_0005708743 /DNA_START=75 /DNA_END=293 /DNA_ORIENTATION=-